MDEDNQKVGELIARWRGRIGRSIDFLLYSPKNGGWGALFYDLLLWFPNPKRKRKALLFLLFCVEYNTALPEDYNIHQNWKIAVEIYQFWGRFFQLYSVGRTHRQTDNPGTIHNVISSCFSFCRFARETKQSSGTVI